MNGTPSPSPPIRVAVHSVTIMLWGPACSLLTINLIASPIEAVFSGWSLLSKNDNVAVIGGGVPTSNTVEFEPLKDFFYILLLSLKKIL